MELLGYGTIVLLLIGQIIVGKYYLLAQIIFTVANLVGTVRSFILHQPRADKLRNAVFFAVSLGLAIAAML